MRQVNHQMSEGNEMLMGINYKWELARQALLRVSAFWRFILSIRQQLQYRAACTVGCGIGLEDLSIQTMGGQLTSATTYSVPPLARHLL
jgi:hypothetical protein